MTPQRRTMTMPAFNYLIVSDLHLRGGFTNRTERLYHFDDEFAEFLRYYRVHRRSERPWHLVIGGDFIEFLFINDLPDRTDRLLRGVHFSASENRYGASTEAPKARWKLDRILRSSHAQLLIALARFVFEGNHVSVLRGNHDSEMFWPEVKEHFRRLIAEHHPQDVSYLQMKDAVRERVQFPDWFFFTPGLLYVEHGCQYDPFCSFEYFMNPVVPERPTHIEMSIAELGIRYFANQMKVINAMAAENIMSVSEYIGWVMRGNLSVMARTLGLYTAMVRHVLAKAGRPHPAAEATVRAEHQRRVAETDALFGLPPGTAATVDGMHATPVMRYRLAIARFLALDLIGGGALLFLAALAIVIWFPANIGLLALVGAVAAVGLIGYVGALRFRRVTEGAQLHRTAERLAALFRVPYVVFGHSHGAGTWPLAGGATYVNVGTWVPEGESAYFVYFGMEETDGTQVARLWRWNKAQREPEPFEA